MGRNLRCGAEMWRDNDENVATAKKYGDRPHEVVVLLLLAPLCRRTLQHQKLLLKSPFGLENNFTIN
jgi:hypothetical protein